MSRDALGDEISVNRTHISRHTLDTRFGSTLT